MRFLNVPKIGLAALAALGVTAAASQAATITADIVISYNEPVVANPGGPFNGVFDGIPNGRDGGPEYEQVDLNIGNVDTGTVIGDGNENTYVSLPTGTEIVVGFSQGFIVDGTGNDLFIDEIGNGGEDANVFVSEDFGSTFTFLAVAEGNRTNNFDFSDFAGLGPDIKVNAVKLVGLDNGGTAPGFDLTFVQGLDGSVVIDPQIPPIPLPAAGWLLLGALGGMGALRRKSRG